MHTVEPRAPFMITISSSLIPSNDTSMERCKAKMDTNASAKVMFRRTTSVAEVLRRDLMRLIVATVIFVKVYAAIAIITII